MTRIALLWPACPGPARTGPSGPRRLHGRLVQGTALFIRLSYMVLPPPLMPLYEQRRGLFRQGASVPEQCVLAEYIDSGELSRQVRRLRKEYQEKGTVRETPGRSLWQRHRRRAPGFRRVLPYPPAQPSSGRRIASPGGTARLSCLIHEVFLRNTVAGNG